MWKTITGYSHLKSIFISISINQGQHHIVKILTVLRISININVLQLNHLILCSLVSLQLYRLITKCFIHINHRLIIKERHSIHDLRNQWTLVISNKIAKLCIMRYFTLNEKSLTTISNINLSSLNNHNQCHPPIYHLQQIT